MALRVMWQREQLTTARERVHEQATSSSQRMRTNADSSASPMSRGSGSYEVDKCEEEEQKLFAETPEQKLQRRARLEAVRKTAMDQVAC